MSVWWMEWRSALARRRLFAWNTAVPILLLAPVALSAAAAPHRTAVFGVFFVFFATFGSAIPTVRDAQAGWLDTIFQSGYPRGRWLTETVVAGTALDFLQLLPVMLILVSTSGRADLDTVATLFLALLFTLAFANLLGPFLAAAVGSLAEAAMVSAATSLLLLHLADSSGPPQPHGPCEWRPGCRTDRSERRLPRSRALLPRSSSTGCPPSSSASG